MGPGVGYRYAEGHPRSRETITDTLRYGAGQSVSQYDGWEPRLTVRVNLLSVNSLTISYNCTR